jgi:hypothetical protein
MADKVWKQTERAIARRLNGKRQGAVGRKGPDVLTCWLAVEVKHRKRLPAWLRDALDQARTGAGERLPVVVLHEAGQRHADDLVILRMADFEDWFGGVRGFA